MFDAKSDIDLWYDLYNSYFIFLQTMTLMFLLFIGTEHIMLTFSNT